MCSWYACANYITLKPLMLIKIPVTTFSYEVQISKTKTCLSELERHSGIYSFSDAYTCTHINRDGEDCLPGSQCCYDEDGDLITGPPSGGTVDIASPQGSVRCYLQHFFQDVLPSIYCCTGLFPDCQSYYQKRPSVPQTGYVPLVPGNSTCMYGI